MEVENNKSPQDEDIEAYLKLNVKLLSYVGLTINLGENEVIRDTKFMKKIPAFLVIALQFYGAIGQTMSIKEAITNDDYFLATQVTSQILSNLLCMSKGYRVLTAIMEVNILLKELTTVWRKYVPCHRIRTEILQKAGNTLSFCKIFITVIVSAVTSFGLPPLGNLVLLLIHRNSANYTIDYNERVFFMKYPFQIQDPVTYFFVLFEEEYILIGCSIFWICGDTFFAQLTTHASLQFAILRSDIVSLMREEISDVTLKKKIVIIIERHKHLLSICRRIEDIYSSVILITVLISGLNICFNIFDMIKAINIQDYLLVVTHGFLLLITILEIAFYCVFAETLTEQTGAICDAVYDSNWTDKNYKIRIYIQMILVRTQHPFYLTAYGFFPVGHKRLQMILNTAFSYYMVLQATD